MIRLNLGQYENKPVIFDRLLATNGHMIILGATGNGKTTQVTRVMIELAEAGVTVLAFDTNNIFSDLQIHPAYLKKFKEKICEVDVYNEGITLPLFTPFIFSDGESEKLVDMVDSVTEAFAKTFKFGVKQKATLRTAIDAVAKGAEYESSGIQAIASKLDNIGTAKAMEVRERISQITDHNVFRDGDLFIKSGKINLVRISKFSDDTQQKIMEILSAILWKYAAKEKFVKEGLYIVFDECQNMDLGKNGMIGKILVEGRRFNLNLILSTQVLSQEAHITKLMTQAALIMNFKPAKSEIRTVAALIDKTREDSWAAILHRLKKGEFVASGAIVYDENLLADPLLVSAYIEVPAKSTEEKSRKVTVKGVCNQEGLKRPSAAILNA